MTRARTWSGVGLLVIAALVTLAGAAGAAPVPARADALMDDGTRAFRRGAFDEAATLWTGAARRYAAAGRTAEQSRALTRLAQALQALGQHRDALATLEAALDLAQRGGDRRQAATVLSALGTVCMATGARDRAGRHLEQAVALARELNDAALTASVLNTLGTLHAEKNSLAEAVAAYTESGVLAERAGRPALAARALVNAARAQQRQAPAAAQAALDRAVERLRALPASHDTAFGLIAAGVLYDDLRSTRPEEAAALLRTAAATLNAGIAAADSVGDGRTASYGWGYLGRLYETERRDPEALQLTRRAVLAAQQVGAPESLYRWQWQAGRLLGKQGRLEDAIGSYRRAVATLQGIRQELTGGPAAASFRESVGPVYLELVDLLLRRAADLGDGAAAATPLLEEARDAVELLKAAELRDYYRDECVDAVRARLTKIDVVSPTAAVIYPILLADRVEILVSLPDGLRRLSVPVGRDTVAGEVLRLRRALEKRTTHEYLPPARLLYDWLVRPLRPWLAAHPIDTLIFVPDGPLRTIPMAALHDGAQFLIHAYAVASTPGLSLTDPRPLPRRNLKVLALGLTEAAHGFPALPHVAAEIGALTRLYGGTALLNRDFSLAGVEQTLRREPITVLHIASHGRFTGDVDDTFLLAFDDKLTMNRLDQAIGLFRFRDEPLELLTLSACETAAGDDRAALGLAGIAIKAGARSALATLWSINDAATADLITAFYRRLQEPAVSRAGALRAAQLEMLGDERYAHPALWSPFVLINNWL